jgi:hypothetical protein
VDECVKKIGVWSGLQLWRAGGKGTPDEFFEDGPFTLHTDNGRPGDTGNFVVLSYFKAVLENFCARYQLVYKTILPDLLPRFDLEHDNPKLQMYQGSFESATAAGWSAATPVWASIGKHTATLGKVEFKVPPRNILEKGASLPVTCFFCNLGADESDREVSGVFGKGYGRG